MAAEDVWSYSVGKPDDAGHDWQMVTYERNTNVLAHQILAGQAALAKQAGVDVDEQAVAQEIVKAMSVDTLATLIKDGLAADVVTELKNRL